MSHLIDLVWASRHVSPMTDIHTFVQDYISAKGGGAISTGLDFLVLGDDGCIRTGYQFVET
jgi:hypothetical protein